MFSQIFLIIFLIIFLENKAKLLSKFPQSGYELEDAKANKAALQSLGIYIPELKGLTDFLIEAKAFVETHGFSCQAMRRKTARVSCATRSFFFRVLT